MKKLKWEESSPNFWDPGLGGVGGGNIYCQSFQHTVEGVWSYIKESTLKQQQKQQNLYSEQKELFQSIAVFLC